VNPPQGWNTSPGGLPKSWNSQAGKQDREAMEAALAKQIEDLKNFISERQAGEKEATNKSSDKAKIAKEKVETDGVILEELEELEEEVAEIKSMLKQLIDRK
jgi:hypothetical protein